ncbi:MAG: hypothetical protein AB8G16_02520 [Gammaproteobacteria bacterium]
MKIPALMLISTLILGCSTSGYYVPTAQSERRDQTPDLVETGSRIPSGEKQAVRDSTQAVDVYSEQELKDDRPANTRDAVKRALRGR